MTLTILVTYATRFGSTEEVAQAIAETLRQDGHNVHCRLMANVHTFIGYHFVVLGSAVNYANWLPTAVDFVRDNQHDLNQLPAALFTVHIQNTGDDADSRQNRMAYLDDVRPYLQPISEGYFAGRFNRRAATELMPKWLAVLMPTIDLRKWQKIRTWAHALSALLPQQDELEEVFKSS